MMGIDMNIYMKDIGVQVFSHGQIIIIIKD